MGAPMAPGDQQDGEVQQKAGQSHAVEENGGENEWRGLAMVAVGQVELKRKDVK